MISQINSLQREIDGRYASDRELQFFWDYSRSFNLRLQTYIKLQGMEPELLQRVQTKMKRLDPSLFLDGQQDLTPKWKQDTLRVLRYSAVAMLLNDGDFLQERLLYWMQTVMKAFGVETSCEVTYRVMQDVIRERLTVAEANLLCPILELNRLILGSVPTV